MAQFNVSRYGFTVNANRNGSLTIMFKDRNHACMALNQTEIDNISVNPKFVEISSQSHTENSDAQSLD